MNKVIGKLYVSEHTEVRENIERKFELVILCTGNGTNERTISGVVVKNNDDFSDFYVGEHSETWSLNSFKEYKGDVILNNNNLKPLINKGDVSR